MMSKLYQRPYARLTPQCQALLTHFEAHETITNMEAQMVHKIRALPRRISDLKAVGYIFTKEWDSDVTGQRYLRYRLEGWEDPMRKAA